MTETQLIILTLTAVVVFSGGLMISLLKKIQKRSQAHDSKITAAFEKNRPFSLQTSNLNFSKMKAFRTDLYPSAQDSAAEIIITEYPDDFEPVDIRRIRMLMDDWR